MKLDPIPGITSVSLASAEQTARELAKLVGDETGAQQVADLAHGSSLDLLAVVEHTAADPALLFGLLIATPGPLVAADLHAYLTESDGDIREVADGRSRRGYPVVLAERVVTPEQLRVGVPFDCQLQAVVGNPIRPMAALFTLSSPTGRGWLALSAIVGRLIASVDFDA